MENKLSQEYKDNLYEKVLEKKRIRTVKRKKLASVCVIFILFVCFATYGFSRIEKENYNNFFVTETENKYIDDEYEYFDDLGIKLEFINVDKDSITLGVNIKYENIAEYEVFVDKIKVIDKDTNEVIIDSDIESTKKMYDFMKLDCKKIDKNNQMMYIICGKNVNKKIRRIVINLSEIRLETKDGSKVIDNNIVLKREISIED